jgi:FkbM family methyltransferase
MQRRVAATMRKAACRVGLDARPYDRSSALKVYRAELLKAVSVVLDVGANTGQWASELRAWGYNGKIISFEPLSEAYARLRAHADKDGRWTVLNLGLGDVSGTKMLFVSRNSQSSSFLEMTDDHAHAAPESQYIGQEVVRVETLDNLKTSIISDEAHVYLKLDVQGFELRILQSASSLFDRLLGVELELSLISLYDDSPSIVDVNTWMRAHGFKLMSIQPAWADTRTGELLQLNGLFTRSS